MNKRILSLLQQVMRDANGSKSNHDRVRHLDKATGIAYAAYRLQAITSKQFDALEGAFIKLKAQANWGRASWFR